LEKPLTLGANLNQLKARTYSLNQINRKVKVPMTMAKPEFHLDHDYCSVRKEMPEKPYFFA
jgi:hypothetical protein